jgi:hypothetical protein
MLYPLNPYLKVRAVMPKENDETQPEGTESEESEDEDVTGGAVTEEEAELEAEVEAGASDTVSRAELLKAIKRRQAATKKARDLQSQIDELKRTNESASEKAIREAVEKTTKALTGTYKPALVKTGAEAALLAAGPKKGKAGIPRLIRLMDMDAIDLTEELDLDGVEEEVERLKEEYPELFGEEPAKSEKDEEEKPATRRRTTSRSQDGAGKKPVEKKLTASEIILRKMRGDDL